ncbi:MAG: potassium transporter Kup [Rhizobiaceae bacterium]
MTSQNASGSAPADDKSHDKQSTSGHQATGPFLGLAVGSIGVVYGDIGTSPLYAVRESLHHAAGDGITRGEVIGVISLMLWALLLVVTLKYVVLIMRADNQGEGGTLSLMALAQKVIGRGMNMAFFLGVAGAALFYGDSVITPAVSVLSAVEGFAVVLPGTARFVLPAAIVIIVLLFSVQSRGTARVAAFFGPIMVLWFATLGVLGIYHIADDPEIFKAFNPFEAAWFLTNHGMVGLVVLGSVFLCVTGAEALYADMGHFGRSPIRWAWMVYVFPMLALNYLGQGAMILGHPETAVNPFFLMAPEWASIPLVVLSCVAAVIASQAVITGAFSLTSQAVQLGILPRLEIRHTSEQLAGQIYLPKVNRLLFAGVIALIVLFQTSSSLASAYGIAVTGAMLADAGLMILVIWKVWKWGLGWALTIMTPLILIDLAFFGANLLKLLDGAALPLAFGMFLMVVMWTWVRGSGIIADKARRESVPLADLTKIMSKKPPQRVHGTAVFLTADPETAPTALMHNLKHNHVLHNTNILLTIKTAQVPYVPENEQITVETLSDDFRRIIANLGYMQSPRIPHLLAAARRKGCEFELMQTSFFLGRRTIKASATSGMPLWQDGLYIALARSAANATDFFHIPYNRVVEMGSQVTV